MNKFQKWAIKRKTRDKKIKVEESSTKLTQEEEFEIAWEECKDVWKSVIKEGSGFIYFTLIILLYVCIINILVG